MVRKIPFRIPRSDKIKTNLVKTTGVLFRVGKSPDEALGELFEAVQKSGVYEDSKTFVDLVPRGRMKAIQEEYRLAHDDPNFDLRDFVSRHFYEFSTASKAKFAYDPNRTIHEHIHLLWNGLERRNRLNRGSLLALPHSYIVPGGRFEEQFYWDSYFIMLGLAADGRWKMIEDMIENFAYMIRKFGYIPTANRTYFLSRSQPPFFSQMVKLLASRNGQTRTHAKYLPSMLGEYRFWMKGRLKLAKTEHKAFARVVELPVGMHLNRYYDDKRAPRPESLHEDTLAAQVSTGRESDRLYLHLRAGAESGWDFSSRWFTDPHDIKTIHTADIIPIDLNCLLYQLEETIAQTYRLLKNPLLARKFERLAEKRKAAIQKYCWDEKEGFFVDYNFHHERSTGDLSLAGVFALYSGVATDAQAEKVAEKLKSDFLRAGGLQTTLIETTQQWDSPNGWAPLQWIAIQGLRRYGYDELADEIKKRWIAMNEKVFSEQYKFVEKYNVEGGDGLGGGGEYPLQDGFGWTNGVYAALVAEDKKTTV